MADIVNLRGEPVQVYPEPHPEFEPEPAPINKELIAKLEELLHHAETGELLSMAWVYVRKDETTGTAWSRFGGQTHLLTTGIGVLNHRYIEARYK